MLRSISVSILCVCLVPVLGTRTWSASPESIADGQKLFQATWGQRDLSLGGDGLGPLFNANSCATCHQQGGIGGSGEAPFNAKALGIEKMEVTGRPMSLAIAGNAVAGFHPGFVDRDVGVLSTLPIPHFGGSTPFREARSNLLAQVRARFSDEGGSADAAEVRRALSTPVLYSSQANGYSTTIRARLFQRNTTALFGAGLIDQITEKEIRRIARLQSRHPEISGRPATLSNGLVGRFGWRANVASLIGFCDRACAAEVGLSTKRVPQAKDPMMPGYNNPSADVSDRQIRAMAEFVAALPAPVKRAAEGFVSPVDRAEG